MKQVRLAAVLTCLTLCWSPSSLRALDFEYEPSADHPFGRPNPEAHANLSDFAPMIGECDCISEQRNPDGTWQDAVKMTWRFKYIMNGLAIQDETLKESGAHAGSIRQVHPESGKWHVYYYSQNSVPDSLSTWVGGNNGDSIVLSMPQKAPNGMEGVSRLTFYDISADGFKWIGEWVDNLDAPSIVYPFWKIDCKK